MLLSLDFSGDTPIYQQIRNQIVVGIASGGLSSGERLPTIRALAEELGVNMMTVNKAYAMLKQEGYITADRRGGTVVAPGSETASLSGRSLDSLSVIASEARLAGISEEKFLRICGERYREGRGGYGHI